MSAVSPRTDFADAFPASTKVYVDRRVRRRALAVPMREIALSGGEPPVRVYDTSGPQGCNVREGLPPIRAEWIARRGQVVETPSSYRPVPGGSAGSGDSRLSERRPVLRGTGPVTQLHYARTGEVTPEMAFVAMREGLDAEFVRSGDRARPGDPAGEHQPPGDRADDHRPELPGEDQREHRQLRGHLVDRGGGRQAALGDALGRRHRDGSLDRTAHPRNARVDRPELRRADRHGADLPGAREGRAAVPRT